LLKTSTETVALIYEREAKVVFRYCLFRTNSYYDAEDLTTEVFIKLLRGKAQHVPKEKIMAWLLKVAENECNLFFRQQQKKKETAWAEFQPEAQIPPPWLAVEVGEAVSRLKRLPKQVLFLKAVEELTFSEIAQTLNISEGAAKMAFYRAVKSLQQKLKRG